MKGLIGNADIVGGYLDIINIAFAAKFFDKPGVGLSIVEKLEFHSNLIWCV